MRLHLLFLILRGIHAATQKEFIKAIKINCSDFVQGGRSLQVSYDGLQLIGRSG